MEARLKPFIALLTLAMLVCIPLTAHSQSMVTGYDGNATGIYDSALLPRTERLKFVSIVQIFAAGHLWGRLVAYDDPTTQRSTDYVELQNDVGDVVAISWFDPFAIARVAVDRALLDDKAELEGVMVMLVEGDPV